MNGLSFETAETAQHQERRDTHDNVSQALRHGLDLRSQSGHADPRLDHKHLPEVEILPGGSFEHSERQALAKFWASRLFMEPKIPEDLQKTLLDEFKNRGEFAWKALVREIDNEMVQINKKMPYDMQRRFLFSVDRDPYNGERIYGVSLIAKRSEQVIDRFAFRVR